VKIVLAAISTRKSGKSPATDAIASDYIGRAARLSPTEAVIFESEASLIAATERQSGRPAALLVLFDSRGDNLSSEEFARYIGRVRDEGTQRLIFAIGPADGWSPATLARAHRTVSFGRMTLPHELARAVVAEQVYRALTILAGHPYHSGH
jgi:23S rRNA (pseudouridine1915-N3)-methyltransferase